MSRQEVGVLEDATLEELRATQQVLQEAHDLIEAHGFDMGTYGYSSLDGTATVAPRCYIGAVRTVAHTTPHPDDGLNGDAGLGNGPELRLALKALDRVALAMHPQALNDAINEVGEKFLDGRVVEHMGFFDTHTAPSSDRGTGRALEVFRAALTEVYKMIEGLQDD